jgi:hypothetical protein
VFSVAMTAQSTLFPERLEDICPRIRYWRPRNAVAIRWSAASFGFRAGRMFRHLLDLLFYNIIYYMKSVNNMEKKRGRGRPATGATPILVRLQPDRLAAIDAWIVSQDSPMTRPEAIRAMLDAVLVIVAKVPGERPAKNTPSLRTVELAANAIEKMIDPAAPPEQHAQRPRRLTKGPPEFREDHVDRPKAKK